MRTRSSSNIPVVSSNPSTSNLKRRNRKRSKQPFIPEESPVDTMADQRTMAESLRAPTEGYAEAIVVLPILANQFELKHSLINMMTTDQFFRLKKDNPHDHIRAACRTTNLRNEISNFQQRFDESFHEAWDRYKDLLHTFPHHGFTELHQLDTFYNALNPADQDSLNAAAGGNLLERRTQDVLTIIENKSKVCNSRNKSVVSQVKSCDANSNSSSEIAKLTHTVNQQTSDVTTAMTAILKQFQATPLPVSVKAVEETCVSCGGAYPYYQCLIAGGNTFLKLQDNIQGYVSAAAVNYNQGNFVYRPPGMANQIRPPGFAQPNASLSNQTNEIKNIMASLFQMNTASTSRSGSLPSNTIANPKGELKAITTRSGIVLDGPTIPTPPLFINPEEDERVEETVKDSDLAEYTIKVPPPLVKKYKPPSQRDFVVHQRDTLHLNIPYPSKMLKQKHELKCKALADLGASIKLDATLCLEEVRDVFVLVGKFTFPADFIIVDYESDHRVPLILGRPFLRTASALIDAHGEEMILRDGDERLTLNIRHDTSSYSNQPQKESINLINVFNNSKGGNVLPEKLLDLDSTKDLYPPLHVNPLSGSTTYSSSNPLLEEFIDELALITFPSKYDDDLQFDVDNLANPADYFVDYMPEMFTDEHALDYSSPLIFDEYDDDFLEVESDAKNAYDDPFVSKGEKIK
nr:hypothetical protein [Tanacetum cinerariifolium]